MSRVEWLKVERFETLNAVRLLMSGEERQRDLEIPFLSFLFLRFGNFILFCFVLFSSWLCGKWD